MVLDRKFSTTSTPVKSPRKGERKDYLIRALSKELNSKLYEAHMKSVGVLDGLRFAG